MNKPYIAIAFLMLISLISGCTAGERETVKIAVIGNEADLYSGYKYGTEKAAADAGAEYPGIDIEYEFYNYDGSYEEGAGIVDMLAADEEVTAVIGAVDMELNKTAAHMLDDAGKIFVVPFFIYDSVFEENHYDTVFSLCNSADKVGDVLCHAAHTTSARRWAVCAADGEFERAEMNGFVQSEYTDGLTVADCVSISELDTNFDEIMGRWDTLGVEGVVIFPTNEEGFDILKRIKARSPEMVCAGDTAFDNAELAAADPELMAAMDGFIMGDEFILDISTDEDMDTYAKIGEQYMQETGRELDSWYFQGYNAVRMITDTAASLNSSAPVDIAGELHENGYSGILQKFSFTKRGQLAEDYSTYNVFDSEGYTYSYIFSEQG